MGIDGGLTVMKMSLDGHFFGGARDQVAIANPNDPRDFLATCSFIHLSVESSMSVHHAVCPSRSESRLRLSIHYSWS